MKNTQKICKHCKSEILLSAKKCPECQSDLRNWFVRHWILSILLSLILLSIIGSSMAPATKTTSTKSSTNTSENGTTSPTSSVSTENTKITREKCNSVTSGMKNDQVKNILGEPTSISESEISGLGKIEYWHYQEGFSMKACAISFSNGKVSSKSWTEL